MEELEYTPEPEYTVVTEIPGDLPADQIPTPSLDGAQWLLRGLHDGVQLTTTEAKQWVKDNSPQSEEE